MSIYNKFLFLKVFNKNHAARCKGVYFFNTLENWKITGILQKRFLHLLQENSFIENNADIKKWLFASHPKIQRSREVNLIRLYVIKIAVDFQEVIGFLWVLRFSFTIDTDHHNITEVLFKVALNTHDTKSWHINLYTVVPSYKALKTRL